MEKTKTELHHELLLAISRLETSIHLVQSNCKIASNNFLQLILNANGITTKVSSSFQIQLLPPINTIGTLEL